ncbi:hypothetical protein ABBQ38_015216 [Trebouxia sp. C0009 RCD-2024]
MTETLRRGYPGMKSIKDMPVLQDGPPPGGFPSVRYARRIPSTGPAGFTLFAVTASIMAYGFIKVGQTNHEKRAAKAEKKAARFAIMPILQAEEDRRYVRAQEEFSRKEKELMKNVPGYVIGENLYSGGRWMPPAPRVGAWGGA